MLDLKFEYAYSSVTGSFKTAFMDAFSKIEQEECLLKMSVFFASNSEENYFENLDFIREKGQAKFGSNMMGISYVSQKPLNSELIIELILAKKESEVLYTSYNDVSYAKVGVGDEKMLFISGIHGKKDQTIPQQSRAIFRVIRAVLEFENMPISSIVRQWNYIPDITRFEKDFQHYQQFNDARTLFYEGVNWKKGFPAATGIGTRYAPLLIDVIAMKGHLGEFPLMNSKQVNAHIYSNDVLLGAGDSVLKQRSTPKFERAKLIEEKQSVSVFVSGTAAIVGEESLALNNASEQTNITIDNIKNLISKEALSFCEPKLEFIRVYVKNPPDYGAVKRVCESRLSDVPAVYVEADICREELLVEIEAFAKVTV
ncbi:hypothetical protein [Flavivirga spongiicola]|uniref:Chorismatase FkbO/Hyg5-like N-terminal domain-containing protein n=1 Tax=Flavivirga spongiicola TaxID=421621 RepID=A0ABU7XZA8_9FLAO|nr:hypothetical protein [Flavivirga sp. MEBiC05379]MDO5981128.1 hypothetical protein [Flavivirga sp. MEBiC05379]